MPSKLAIRPSWWDSSIPETSICCWIKWCLWIIIENWIQCDGTISCVFTNLKTVRFRRVNNRRNSFSGVGGNGDKKMFVGVHRGGGRVNLDRKCHDLHAAESIAATAARRPDTKCIVLSNVTFSRSWTRFKRQEKTDRWCRIFSAFAVYNTKIDRVSGANNFYAIWDN